MKLLLSKNMAIIFFSILMTVCVIVGIIEKMPIPYYVKLISIPILAYLMVKLLTIGETTILKPRSEGNTRTVHELLEQYYHYMIKLVNDLENVKYEIARLNTIVNNLTIRGTVHPESQAPTPALVKPVKVESKAESKEKEVSETKNSVSEVEIKHVVEESSSSLEDVLYQINNILKELVAELKKIRKTSPGRIES